MQHGNASKPEAANGDHDKAMSEKGQSKCVQKIIEVLQDRCEETGKDLEAPPIVRKVLNIIFLVLGVSLLLGVLVAVIVTVVQEVDGKAQNADLNGKHHDRAKVIQPTLRQTHLISWPPRVLVPKTKDPWNNRLLK